MSKNEPDAAGPEPAEVFPTRRDCLIASMATTRRVWCAKAGSVRVWGLAHTEHQFRLAVSHHKWTVGKLNRSELQQAMCEELSRAAGPVESEADHVEG